MKSKKNIFAVTILSLSALLVVSCGGQTSNSSTSKDPFEDWTTPSETSEEELPSTSESNEPYAIDYQVIDNYDKSYQVGEKFFDHANLTYAKLMSDGNTIDITNEISQQRIYKIAPPSNGVMSTKQAFSYSGRHMVTIEFLYEDKSYLRPIPVNVLSGLECGYSVKEINITRVPKAYIGSLFIPNGELTFDLVYQNNAIEHFTYFSKLENIQLSLYKNDDLSKNVIDEEIIKDVNYTLKITIGGVSETLPLQTVIADGFKKLDSLSITAPDIDHTYSSAVGDLNVLVIPIQLDDTDYYGYYWSDRLIEKANKEFFGSQQESHKGWNSLKTYYETASFGKVQISGMVSKVYKPIEPNLTMRAINEDKSYRSLHLLIKKAVMFAQAAHPEVDWTTYDRNNDGRLDAVHLITNAPDNPAKITWNDPLWPHMAHTGFAMSHELPQADIYSISSLGHFESSRTQVHEQGHMLGLEDYYDYTYNRQGISPVGKADMQDMNMFDWNSFSKMSVGWVNPFVIDGTKDSTTITLSAAALNGDCLVIPANYHTYNGSAYDEYVLIELFSPLNNNKLDWVDYEQEEHKDLGPYGVKMYHVDARLWAYDGDIDHVNKGHEVKDIDEVNTAIGNDERVILGCNNTLDANEYAIPSPKVWHDFNLLTNIRHSTSMVGALDKNDLWHQGDKFIFKAYSRMFSKSFNNVTTMDNGEIFPYEITFEKMSKEEVTIRVDKVK